MWYDGHEVNAHFGDRHPVPDTALPGVYDNRYSLAKEFRFDYEEKQVTGGASPPYEKTGSFEIIHLLCNHQPVVAGNHSRSARNHECLEQNGLHPEASGRLSAAV